MYEHGIRWYALVPVAMLVCLAVLLVETAGLWPRAFPARPDWLWALVFFTTLKTKPVPSIAAFALCGLFRDVMLGPRLGAGVFAYVTVGWMMLHWRMLATPRGWFSQLFAAGASAFLVALLRHALDYGPQAYKLMYRILFVSFADGVLTALVYVPMAGVLCLEAFRPWRRRDGY